MIYLYHWLLLAGSFWVTFRLYVWLLLEKRQHQSARTKKAQGKLVLLGALFAVFLLISCIFALLALMELGEIWMS